MRIEKNVVLLHSQLPNGVMVASQILALIVRVRVLIGQRDTNKKVGMPWETAAYLFLLVSEKSFC